MALRVQPERNFLACFIAVIVLLELLVSFQGFDLCDEGWALSGYQQFFNDPSSVQYQFLYYNSLVIGGLWNACFGQYGIIAFRLLDSLFILMTALAVYYTLRSVVNRWAILLGVVAMILMRDWGSMIFNHNSISALICVLSVGFLYRGLASRTLVPVLVAFVLVGINVFSRLPNLSLLVLGILPVIDFLYKKDIRLLLLQLGACLLGLVIGISLPLAMMKLTGNFPIFTGALDELHSAGSDKDSTHQISYMLQVYVHNYLDVLKIMVAMSILAIAFAWVQQKVKATYVRLFLSVLIFLACVYLSIRWQSTVNWSYGITILVLGVTVWLRRHEAPVVFLGVMALVTANFLPLGSDFGIGNMGYASLWITWPLAVGLLSTFIARLPPELVRPSRHLALALFSLFVIRQGVTIAQTCYFDLGSRFEKRFKVDHPLASTYTTREKAQIMTELLAQLKHYVKKDDYLLCFQSLPMVNYLTETRPYLYNSWVWTYDPSLLRKKFSQALASRKELPVIVREKCQPLSGTWTVPDPSYNRTDLPTDYVYKGTKIQMINTFEQEHHYTVAWESPLFQILVPPSFSRNR